MPYTALSDDISTLSQFTRRKAITITTGGTSTPANYQVKLTIAHEPEMQAGFDDLRFNTLSGGYIDYWIESYTTSTNATIWIELPDTIIHIGSDTIYMFYGNAGLDNGSDIEGTFTFGDDFSGSFPGTNWTGAIGNGSVSGGILTFTGSDAWTRIYSDIQSSPDMALSIRAKILTNGQTGYIGYQNNSSNNGRSIIYDTGLWTYDDGGLSEKTTDDTWSFDEWHIFDLLQDSGTSVKLYIDNILGITHTVRVGTSAQTINIASYTASVEVDWVISRKLIDDEPTPSYGTVQHQRRVPQFIG